MALAFPFLAGKGLRPILPEGGDVSDEDVEPSAPPGKCIYRWTYVRDNKVSHAKKCWRC